MKKKRSAIRTVLLDDLEKMHERGELYHDPNAPEGPELGEDFWKNAVLVEPGGKRSVHLKLEPAVFEFFFVEADGKGHLTKMQNVLKAYVRAQSGAQRGGAKRGAAKPAKAAAKRRTKKPARRVAAE